MMVEHESLVWFARTFGLFYLMALSAAVVAYAYWPANRRRFDRAAHAILDDEDRPCP